MSVWHFICLAFPILSKTYLPPLPVANPLNKAHASKCRDNLHEFHFSHFFYKDSANDTLLESSTSRTTYPFRQCLFRTTTTVIIIIIIIIMQTSQPAKTLFTEVPLFTPLINKDILTWNVFYIFVFYGTLSTMMLHWTGNNYWFSKFRPQEVKYALVCSSFQDILFNLWAPGSRYENMWEIPRRLPVDLGCLIMVNSLQAF